MIGKAKLIYSGVQIIDTIHILQYINDFTKNMTDIEDVEINYDTIECIVDEINNDFPHNGGLKTASVFKKTAYFMAQFIEKKPIFTKLPKDFMLLGNYNLGEIENALNTLVAYSLAVDMLKGAIIKSGAGDKILTNRIGVSVHSLIDIIDALSTITTRSHWRLLSVTLEQMAYRANPDCSYKLEY